MLDPKFQYLPYIAREQETDVYETDDVETSEAKYYEEENDNESIDKSKLNPNDAYRKFKGKYLVGNIDFSDNIGKRRKPYGYTAVSGIYEINGEGEKETPLQKAQRLQCEMSELMDEITTLQSDNTVSKEERESYDGVSQVVMTAKKVLDSLRLEQVLGKEAVASSSEKQLKNLISQVEEYKKGAPSKAPELNRSDLAYTTRIAELEHKLHQLEQTVGVKLDKISRLNSSLGTKNLLEAVQQLSTKSALLQPNQLDVIEQRLANLATKMDQFNDKAAGSGTDPARDQKIVELYDLAKTTEPITKILPDMLERMRTLESLHAYAANVSKLFAELEQTQGIILKGIASNKELLQGVQKAFVENNENVQKEILKLENRVVGVTGKK